MNPLVDAYAPRERLAMLVSDGWHFVELERYFHVERRTLSNICSGRQQNCSPDVHYRVLNVYVPTYPPRLDDVDDTDTDDDDYEGEQMVLPGFCCRTGCVEFKGHNGLGLCDTHYRQYLDGSLLRRKPTPPAKHTPHARR